MGAPVAAPDAVVTGAVLPAGFTDTVAFSGLTNPTAVAFAADGRVFVAEKSGLIKVFASMEATTPTIFADLRTSTHNFWDRGLLGMTLDPGFPARPYVYALYTFDHILGDDDPEPRWGTVGATSDGCPTPPGPTTDGCVVSARLSRLTASGSSMSAELVLVEGWCQQFPSHTIGTVRFGSDGALYASAGDGADFNRVDYGNWGGTLVNTPTPKNPCGDPPVGVGGTQAPPTAQGGSLRSQSVRGLAPDLDGSIIRVDPDTGEAMPDNPAAGDPDPNVARIVAYGLRNPFRFTIRPGTDDLWIGDVGAGTWEEIDVADTDAPVENFGWPCYEGIDQAIGWRFANLDLCDDLYAAPGDETPPFFTYNHAANVVEGETCPTGSSSITGVAFYPTSGGAFPAAYQGALFFTDHARNCIWSMSVDGGGLPEPSTVAVFEADAENPVQLEIGPDGNLWYADLEGGKIHRISYSAGNQPPVAVIEATPDSGLAPLLVNFDGGDSFDPDGGGLTYSWDLDGNGTYGDSTSQTPSLTYNTPQLVNVGLRVTDTGSATGGVTRLIAVGSPPVPIIDDPPPGTTWGVGDVVAFAGSATDGFGGELGPSGLSWDLIIHHCPAGCHTHGVQSWEGVASGSFVTPDHEYPSFLELVLTATDDYGLTASTSLDLDPDTIGLTLASVPSGLDLALDLAGVTTPETTTVIAGSSHTISAPATTTIGGGEHAFLSWSDGLAATHGVTVGGSPVTYTATYANATPVAAAKVVSVTEDVAKAITLTATDADEDDLAFAIVSGPTKGTLGAIGSPSCGGNPWTCSANVTYTPNANISGTDAFTYRAVDGFGNSAAKTVSLTIAAVNDPPTAVADTVNLPKGTSSATLDVLANDSSAPDSGETLTVTAIVTAPTHGTASIPAGGGSVTYAPATGYSGPDSLVYRISDGHGGTAQATVSISIDGSIIFGAVTRESGADRYATAAAVSAAHYAPGVNVVFITTGANFPDALAAAAAAGKLGGPLLLVNPALSSLPTSTAAELNRLKPKAIVVVGGTGAVSTTLFNALDPYTTGALTRESGADRYATAAAVSAAHYAPGVNVVFITTGANFPDALAAAAAAGKLGGPLLLVNPALSSLPTSTAAELNRLKPKAIVVVGGTGAVSTTLFNALDPYTTGALTRESGADRYATAAAVSAAHYAPGVNVVFITTGANFPDALAAAAAAGKLGAPLLLVNPALSSLPTSTAAELNRLKPKAIVVVGGTGAVSTTLFNALEGYLAS